MSELSDTEIEVMVLCVYVSEFLSILKRTYPNTSHISSNSIQYWHHMTSCTSHQPQFYIPNCCRLSTFRHTALQTWIKGITGEEGEKVRLSTKSGILSVLIANGLETSNPAYRFSGGGIDVVNFKQD